MKKNFLAISLLLIVAFLAMGLQYGKAGLTASHKPFTAVFQTSVPAKGVVSYDTVAYKEDGSYAMASSQTKGDRLALVTIYDLQKRAVIAVDPMTRMFWQDSDLPPGFIQEKAQAPTSCLTSIGKARIADPQGQCQDAPSILGLKVKKVEFANKIRRREAPDKDSGSVRRVEYRAVDYNFYPIKVETYMTPPDGQEQLTGSVEVVDFKPGKPDEALFRYDGFKEEKEAGAMRNATGVVRGLPPMTAEEQQRETIRRIEQRKAARDRYKQ